MLYNETVNFNMVFEVCGQLTKSRALTKFKTLFVKMVSTKLRGNDRIAKLFAIILMLIFIN